MDFDYDTDFINYVEKNDKPRPNWNQVLANQPPVLYFSYRQSPQYMVATDFHDLLLTPGVVNKNDPPTTLSGMINLSLDSRGRLLYLQAIPPEKDSEATTSKVMDWNPVSISRSSSLRRPFGIPSPVPTRARHGQECGPVVRGRCASKVPPTMPSRSSSRSSANGRNHPA